MENVVNTLKGIVNANANPLFCHSRSGLSAPAIHPNNKPGAKRVASYSDVVENKSTSKPLKTIKGKRKAWRGLRNRKGNFSAKSSSTYNFYCANANSFKSKADSTAESRI